MIPGRSQDGEAATDEKTDLKTAIASKVDYVCSSASVYALEIEDTTLYNTVNFTTSDVVRMRDGTTPDKNKTASTDSKGTYELIKLMPGERTFTITAPGYDSQTITVKIIRGAILTLDITLHAQTISINATA